jgi:hypothetical protein
VTKYETSTLKGEEEAKRKMKKMKKTKKKKKKKKKRTFDWLKCVFASVRRLDL